MIKEKIGTVTIMGLSLRHSKFDIYPSRGHKLYSAVLFLGIFCGFVSLSFLLQPLPVHAEVAQTCKDSIITTAPDANFTIHNDGTATHKTTGLMWMRCTLGQTWDGKTCSGSPATYTWKAGLEAADHHEFAGYDDWRMPNKNELESIVEERCYSSSINAIVFPDTPSAYFWSSSPYAGFSQGAWSVDFGFGAVNASDKDGSIHVRLVRDVE